MQTYTGSSARGTPNGTTEEMMYRHGIDQDTLVDLATVATIAVVTIARTKA